MIHSDSLRPFIYIAGAFLLLIASANFFLPAKIELKANLEKVSLFIRQIFHVHTVFLVLISVFFSVLCFVFTDELTQGSALGRFLSGFISVYWLLRVSIQFFYYDPAIKKKFPVAHWFFSLVFIYLAAVFAVSALQGL